MVRRCCATLLTLVFCMLAAALPATAGPEVAGRWEGAYGQGTLTLLLGSNGMYISVYEDAGTFYKEAGSYLEGGGTLVLRASNGNAVTYRLQHTQSSLTFQNTDTGGWFTVSLQPWGVSDDVIGEWEGDSDGESIYLTLMENSTFFAYDDWGGILSEGIFLCYGDRMLMLDSNENLFDYTFESDLYELDLTDKNGYTYAFYWFPEDTYETPAPPEETPYATAVPDATATPDVILLYPVTDTPAATPGPVPTDTPPGTAAPAPPETPPAPSGTPLAAYPAQPGLAGTWMGKDASGDISLMLSESGEITLTRQGDAGVRTRKGTYAADAASVTAAFDDGTVQVFRYMLTRDTLLFSDEDLSNPVTLTRSDAPTQGMDPLLAGTWGFYTQDAYMEWSFSADGSVRRYIPAWDIPEDTGKCVAADGRYAITWDRDGAVTQGDYTFTGDTLQLTGAEAVSAFIRRQAPLARLDRAAEAATPAADALILGSWGGMEDGAYMEWTFFGNGQFTRFAPSDDARSESGTYMAVNGSMAVMTLSATFQGSYTVSGDTLAITLDGLGTVGLQRKPGQLVRGPAAF